MRCIRYKGFTFYFIITFFFCFKESVIHFYLGSVIGIIFMLGELLGIESLKSEITYLFLYLLLVFVISCGP